MTDKFLIVKYGGTYGRYDDKIRRTFLLDKNYTKKFKKNPILKIKIRQGICMYGTDFIELEKIFIKELTLAKYNFIKELELTDDATELFEILDEN